MKPLTGDDIADLILFIVTRPAHVNISDSIIFPTAQASSTLVNRDQS
jgi:NADP-dependent 3-hydroxy acid dehydrogenase YdfG